MDELFDLKDFFLVILRKWRWLVVFVLVFGALGAGYKLIPALMPPTDSTEAQEQFDALQQKYLSDHELLTFNVESMKKELEAQKKNIENSPLLQLDEYASYCGTLGYYVVSNVPKEVGEDDQSLLLAAQMKELYLHFLRSTDLYQLIAEQYGSSVAVSLMSEIVSVSGSSGNLFQVQIVGANETDINKLLDVVQKYVAEKSKAVEESIGLHTIQMVSRTLSQQSNSAIQNARNTAMNKISTLNTSLIDAEEKLKALVAPSQQGSISKKSVLKYAILGVVVGGGFAVLWIYFLNMLNPCITDEEELRKKFGIHVLGRFNKATKGV